MLCLHWVPPILGNCQQRVAKLGVAPDTLGFKTELHALRFRVIQGLYREYGQENSNYYSGFKVWGSGLRAVEGMFTAAASVWQRHMQLTEPKP